MISIMQASYFSEMLDAAWSVPTVDEGALADTPHIWKNTEPALYYPKHTSDDEAESDRLILVSPPYHPNTHLTIS